MNHLFDPHGPFISEQIQNYDVKIAIRLQLKITSIEFIYDANIHLVHFVVKTGAVDVNYLTAAISIN